MALMKGLRTKPPVQNAWIVGTRCIAVQFISPKRREATLELKITEDAYDRWLKGESVEMAFPLLSSEEQEMFRTGRGPGEVAEG